MGRINVIMGKIDWKYEIILSVGLFAVITLVLPAFKVENNVIWLAGIIVGVATSVLVGIKIYFFKQKLDLENSISKLLDDFSEKAGSMVNPMFNKISTMKEPERTYAKKIITEASRRIEKIADGSIYLNESEYFDEIISEVEKTLKDETILAVNSFDARRFIHDPREKIYFDKNKEAICSRNVIINRIFIYDDIQLDMNIRNEKLSSIKMNIVAGINIFIVLKSELNNLKNANELCEDAVMFGHEHDNPRLYIDYQDKIDPTRISHGELRINISDIEQFKKHFNTLKNMAISEQDKLNLLAAI